MAPAQPSSTTALSPAAPAAAAPSTPLLVNLLSMAVPPALDYAQKWLNQEHVQPLLEALPGNLEKTGSQVAAHFRKMSTVEKVASGLLLAIVVRSFLRNDNK